MNCKQERGRGKSKYSEVPHYIELVFILAMLGGGIWNIIYNVRALSAIP
jgi:hypothetical protein